MTKDHRSGKGRFRMVRYSLPVALFIAAAAPMPLAAQTVAPQAAPSGIVTMAGLLPVAVDQQSGRILITLPAPDSDGVSGRFLYSTALRTGVGSAPIGLDHAQFGPTQILAFRRMGAKVALIFENPRFRATGGTAAEQAAAQSSFATSAAWLADVVNVGSDGRITIDITGFLTQDVMGIAAALERGGGKGWRRDGSLSVADPQAVRVFPDNIELEALQTYVSDAPGDEISNIAPDPRLVSVTVRHSLIRLPEPGFQPLRLDPRSGAFGTQAVDYGSPLGGDVVYDLANHFRLEKTDPGAARSRVRKPIIFYIDRAAPEPIRTALAEGVRWWADAFDAAGYIDAFRVDILPEGADPLDVRYNVVNWVNRATRGWSYGQTITDPRTGEIVKGAVLLGSLRTRQDILIYEALLGTAGTGQGGPNDPVQIALSRIRQLGAHEVGHALGLEHNFAASTQDRASVMDYPAPRIGLRNGAPDLSDAYGVGIGAWDRFAINWLYGAPPPGVDIETAAHARAAMAASAGLRFASDNDGRPVGSGNRWSSLWDDGADPVAELNRMMEVRRIAIARFGLPMLRTGEPVANLRRKFVPVWLLHRYQAEAAAKLIGGVDFAYPINGGGQETAISVPATEQRAAIEALVATLAPEALSVPPALVPLLSAGAIGNEDRQTSIELFASAGGPLFDPLAAADAAARVTLDAMFARPRLQRLALQHAATAAMPGIDDLLDKLEQDVLSVRDSLLARRIAYRTIVSMARVAGDASASPEVALAFSARLHALSRTLARSGGDEAARDWASALARQLSSDEGIRALGGDGGRSPTVPPGMPIGASDTDWLGAAE